MQLRLHNTLTRTKEAFEPSDPSNVRLYVCGPTVYQRIHVGNARPLVVFDVLFRLLSYLYPGKGRVTYVRNITDIDDKIIAQAVANGETIGELTERTTRQFHEDAAALGCLPPTHEPRATDFIPRMIALAETLVAKGHAYAAEGHVLFHVPSMPAYGRLSGRDRADQIAGARVDVAPYKRDPADFVLWKPSTPDQPGWESPWGRGRPGWHLECSAMSEALLGPLPFDIHGGGIDLIFPHHENEIAQSCCARDVERMARVWMHNGFVDMRGEKMAKSVGNVVRVDEALSLADESPIRQQEVCRAWMFGTHYRQPIDFSQDSLRQSRASLDRLYEAMYSNRVISPDDDYDGVFTSSPLPAGDLSEDFLAVLKDDLNTSEAMKVLHKLADDSFRLGKRSAREEAASKLLASAQLIGLLQVNVRAWRKGIIEGSVKASTEPATAQGSGTVALAPAHIVALIEEREGARRSKDFARADAIRAELARYSIVLEDKADGTTDWRRA